MTKKKKTNKKKTSKVKKIQKNTKKPIAKIIAIVATLSLLFWIVFNNKTKSVVKTSQGKIGPVNSCRIIPPIAKARGLTEPMMIDLRQIGYDGLRIIEGRENGKILQLDEWDDAGHLGPYALDEKGNIYTAPVPHVSLEVNKPEDQNRILKVDGKTGRMKEYIRFPRPDKTGHNSPFGVMGLAYDCETKSIYASSIAGSGPNQSTGVIYQVNLESKEIISKLEGIDAIGIGIFNTKNGKKMFFGSAREPEVFSIRLDVKGHFDGKPEFVFSLAAQQGGSADRAHRVRFSQNKTMEVKGIEFGYSLMAASDPMRNIYNFDYDEVNDNWIPKGVYKQ